MIFFFWQVATSNTSVDKLCSPPPAQNGPHFLEMAKMMGLMNDKELKLMHHHILCFVTRKKTVCFYALTSQN